MSSHENHTSVRHCGERRCGCISGYPGAVLKQHRGSEARRYRIERGGSHAMIGRESENFDLLYTTCLKPIMQRCVI